MVVESPDERLHLPSLRIENFRGIESLTIPRLGRVTLLTGKNGVGKSTVLEAVHIYANRGQWGVPSDTLTARQEVVVVVEREGETVKETFAPDFTALFYGRSAAQETTVKIGVLNDKNQVEISPAPFMYTDTRETFMRVLHKSERDVFGINIKFGGKIAHPHKEGTEFLPTITTAFWGSGRIESEVISDLWQHVALKDEEIRAVDALKIIHESIERVTVIGDSPVTRRAIVRLRDYDGPVPLRSLGDGSVRLFALALFLAYCTDGFLLIDDAEGGIHHSIQQDYWRMVLQAAHDNNVQVIATTHSWDCVRGFAQATVENEEVESVLIRLERDDAGLHAIEYSKDRLRRATEHGSEVR